MSCSCISHPHHCQGKVRLSRMYLANNVKLIVNASLLSSLTQLFIGGNHLSDVGLQRLTAPIRIMKKGLDSLELLDVSRQ